MNELEMDSRGFVGYIYIICTNMYKRTEYNIECDADVHCNQNLTCMIKVILQF